MNRGLFAIFAIGSAVACGGGGGGDRRRIEGAQKADVPKLAGALELQRAEPSTGSLVFLAEVVAKQCGAPCACLSSDDDQAGDKSAQLFTCPSLCDAAARDKARAAPPGQQVRALADACSATRIGLRPDQVALVGNDWLAAFVVGQYLADQLALAGGEEKRQLAAAMAAMEVPLFATAAATGVTLPEARKVAMFYDGRELFAVDAAGEVRHGTWPTAVFSPTGTQLRVMPPNPFPGGRADAVHVIGKAGRAPQGNPPFLVAADVKAPAHAVLGVMAGMPGGPNGATAVLGVAGARHLDTLDVLFESAPGTGAPSGTQPDLVIEVGADAIMIGASVVEDYTRLPSADAGGIEAAIRRTRSEAFFADRDDVVVVVRADARAAQLVLALDAALAAGARVIRVTYAPVE